MKKSFVFTFIMTIVSAVIGAGFASGKEVISFFGSYGYMGLFFVLIAFFLFFFCFYIFAKLGKVLRPKSISDFSSAMFGKAGIFVDFAFILSTFITLSSMLAGSDSIGSMVFGASYNFCYISIFTTMIVTIIVFYGIKYIYKITNAVLPVMLVVILATIIVFLIGFGGEPVSFSNTSNNAFEGIIYAILYVFMNTFSNIFIIGKTSQYIPKKQIGLCSILSSAILSIFVALIIITILSGGNSVFLSDMPMLAAANSIGAWFGYIYGVILWFAIFTTICIASYTIVEWLNNYINSKFLCAVITLSLAFIFSRFGFSTIVDVFYPIEGIFGGFFIVYSIIFYFKNRKRFFAQELKYTSINKFAESENIVPDKEKFEEMFSQIDQIKSESELLKMNNKNVKNNEKDLTKLCNKKNCLSKSNKKQSDKKKSQKSKKNYENKSQNILMGLKQENLAKKQNGDLVSIKIDKKEDGIHITKKYSNDK